MKNFMNNSTIPFILILICGFFPVSVVQAQKQIDVMVSILPQRYFVEKIGGEHVKVTVMVPPGSEPHSFEPKPQQLISLSRSSIYFAIGITFEQTWLERFRATNPRMLVVHTEDGIEKIPMETVEETTDERHEHHNRGSDPHIWLSPPLVKKQCEHIYHGLVTVDQGNKDSYKGNFDRFIRELDDLDRYLKDVLTDNNERTRFLVFHPSWGYFARTYGLEQIPIEIEGKEPKPADLIRLIDTAKLLGIRVIFVQPQFSEKSAKTIADAIGGTIVYADPLSENWEQNLRDTAQKFKSALR